MRRRRVPAFRLTLIELDGLIVRSSDLSTIAGAIFMVSDSLGNVLPGGAHGLFVADTRLLSRFELQIGDADLALLRCGALSRGRSEVYATTSGTGAIPTHSLEIRRRREIADCFTETIELTNRGDDLLEFPVNLTFDADFADIFEVRSGVDFDQDRGIVELDEGVMRFRDRRRETERWTAVQFEPPPDAAVPGAVRYDLRLGPGEVRAITVIAAWSIPRQESSLPAPVPLAHDAGDPVADWLALVPNLQTDDPHLLAAYRQAMEDIATLEIPLDTGHTIPAAGLPWYLAIFGRDSIITSLQCLLTGRRQAVGTLRALAAYQSNESNDFRDAEPGKIVHEVRFGELASSETIPHARYYGTVDATPLWLILLDATLAWDGSPELLNELLPHAEAALAWIDSYGDLDGDGFVEYERRSSGGLLNQGWKDSVDSVRFADGALAAGPIALVEVQGYVYAAKQAMANIYERTGQDARSAQLRDEAVRLRRRIHQAFWMPSEGFYAMALDGRKQQVTSITSNPGHLLWCGAVEPEYAGRVARRLLAPDMFSGWGIRTMAATMGGYNPFSYHNGSVWPHDNSLIAAGLARYGFGEMAKTVIDALIDASTFFDQSRLPELFCGYARESTPFPVDYPVACSPQAWAAGSIILMVQTLAGITVTDGKLRANPLDHQRRLRLIGVQTGDAVYSVDCGNSDP